MSKIANELIISIIAHREQQVHDALEVLAQAQADLEDAINNPLNHIYLDIDSACYRVEDFLLDKAGEDCEGSHNFGMPEYEQEFIVDGKHYIGKLEVEYNRHDKTYYYVDEYKFSYKEKE